MQQHLQQKNRGETLHCAGKDIYARAEIFSVKTWWFASGWRVPPSFRPGCWARLIILILHSRTDDPMHLGTIKNRVEFWRQLHVYSAANLVNFKIACLSAIVLLLGNDVPTYLNWLLAHTIGSLDFLPKRLPKLIDIEPLMFDYTFFGCIN